jgi:putative salt-induced outer membrane protein YdiY
MLRRLTIVLALCAWGAAARADTLVLANGDTLTGEVVEWAVDHVVIEHPQLGLVRLSLEQLDIDPGTPPSRGLFGTNFLRGWNRSINLGLNGKRGNSVSTNLTAGFDFNYSDEFKRWRFNGRYFFNESDDGDNDNNARVDLRRDWLIPDSDWFAFSSFRYQFDQFESWKHRTTFGVGPGYHLVDTESHKLDTMLGAAFTREYAGDKDNKGEALFGLDYTWQLSERHSVTLANSLFVEFRPNAGEIRNLTTGEWKLRLTEDPGLNLKIGGENEYETGVAPGDTNNDLKYYLALGLDF